VRKVFEAMAAQEEAIGVEFRDGKGFWHDESV
jgi:hypothetical protein